VLYHNAVYGDVARHFTEMVTNGLGAANTTEFLFVANPVENSLIRGTLNVLGLENVSFEARMTGPPLPINVLILTVAIRFNPVLRANPILRAFTGSAAQAGAAPPVSATITIRAPS
jgi:hypothetical protein